MDEKTCIIFLALVYETDSNQMENDVLKGIELGLENRGHDAGSEEERVTSAV